ncbi:MAG: hypothetical protein ACKOHK_13725, partial [Planctomycetia bacterium]
MPAARRGPPATTSRARAAVGDAGAGAVAVDVVAAARTAAKTARPVKTVRRSSGGMTSRPPSAGRPPRETAIPSTDQHQTGSIRRGKRRKSPGVLSRRAMATANHDGNRGPKGIGRATPMRTRRHAGGAGADAAAAGAA